MRLVVLLLVTACAGAPRPAVVAKLSELPEEAERRDPIIDSAQALPGPEQKPKSKTAQKVETYAATAAAVIGTIFSRHPNVLLGGSTPIDENRLFEDAPKQRKKNPGDTDDKQDGQNEKDEPPPTFEPGEPLVPWVQLK